MKKNYFIFIQEKKQGGLQIASLIKCCVTGQVKLICAILMPLIGGRGYDSIKKTGFQEEEGMVELTGFARSISTVMTVSENLARQNFLPDITFGIFNRRTRSRFPTSPTPSRSSSKQMLTLHRLLIHTHVFYFIHIYNVYCKHACKFIQSL